MIYKIEQDKKLKRIRQRERKKAIKVYKNNELKRKNKALATECFKRIKKYSEEQTN